MLYMNCPVFLRIYMQNERRKPTGPYIPVAKSRKLVSYARLGQRPEIPRKRKHREQVYERQKVIGKPGKRNQPTWEYGTSIAN